MHGDSYTFIVQVSRQLCVDIVNEFAKKNARVTLITGEISNTRIQPDPSVNVKIFCRYNKKSLAWRMFTWLFFTKQVFIYLLFSRKSSKLVFITTPPFTPFIGLLFRFLFGQKYTLVVWDLYPDALLSLNGFRKSNFIYRLWSRLNYYLVNSASVTITLGEYMSKAISQYSLNKSNPIVIHNWADTAVIKPMSKDSNQFAIQHNQVNKLTVIYSGNMGSTHDFESLIYAAKHLTGHTDINFMFVGEGPKKKFIEDSINEFGLKNVLILPFQPNDMFPYSITTGDISVVTLEQGMATVSVPSKTYSALAAGNVLLAIAPQQSELGLIIERYECGKLFEPGDQNGIRDFILSLYNDRNLLATYRKKSIEAAKDFTPENARLYYEHISKSN